MNNRRPTPQTVIEAVMYCVRARGLGALKERANSSIGFASAMRGHRRKSTDASTSFLSWGFWKNDSAILLQGGFERSGGHLSAHRRFPTTMLRP